MLHKYDHSFLFAPPPPIQVEGVLILKIFLSVWLEKQYRFLICFKREAAQKGAVMYPLYRDIIQDFSIEVQCPRYSTKQKMYLTHFKGYDVVGYRGCDSCDNSASCCECIMQTIEKVKTQK